MGDRVSHTQQQANDVWEPTNWRGRECRRNWREGQDTNLTHTSSNDSSNSSNINNNNDEENVNNSNDQREPCQICSRQCRARWCNCITSITSHFQPREVSNEGYDPHKGAGDDISPWHNGWYHIAYGNIGGFHKCSHKQEPKCEQLETVDTQGWSQYVQWKWGKSQLGWDALPWPPQWMVPHLKCFKCLFGAKHAWMTRMETTRWYLSIDLQSDGYVGYRHRLRPHRSWKMILDQTSRPQRNHCQDWAYCGLS